MSRITIVLGLVGVILLVLGGLAYLPVSTSALASHPRPIRDYATADSVASRRKRADDAVTAPGGSSLLLLHGFRTPRVVVLLHGFTNSPTQFASLAQQLYSQGDNVYVPRLPHHGERGSRAATLAHMSAEEVSGAADSAIDVAAGLGDSIVVIGLSAGGTMGCWITQFRADVQRVIIVAPVIALAGVPRLLDAPVRNLAVRLPNVTHADTVDSTAVDREEGWTSRAVGQILRLGLSVRRAAARLSPTAREVRFLLNAHDHTISNAAALELAGMWSRHGGNVQAYELADSLGLPHDVIDPRQRVRRLDVVYPALVALAKGSSPTAETVRALPIPGASVVTDDPR